MAHMKSSSHREFMESVKCEQCEQTPPEYYNSQDLKIQSYSLSIGPENEKNILEFLWNTLPLNEDLFMCSCEDFNSKNRQLLFGDFDDMTLTPKTSTDDCYIFKFEEDLDL
jgi:hypothetical protein